MRTVWADCYSQSWATEMWEKVGGMAIAVCEFPFLKCIFQLWSSASVSFSLDERGWFCFDSDFVCKMCTPWVRKQMKRIIKTFITFCLWISDFWVLFFSLLLSQRFNRNSNKNKSKNYLTLGQQKCLRVAHKTPTLITINSFTEAGILVGICTLTRKKNNFFLKLFSTPKRNDLHLEFYVFVWFLFLNVEVYINVYSVFTFKIYVDNNNIWILNYCIN